MKNDRTITDINPFENPIRITCKTKDHLSLTSITIFQGNLKKLNIKNRDKLINSIFKEGFMCPIFIWKNEEVNNSLDGTQRLTALLYLQNLGWIIPDLPVVYISAENEKDAKQKLLKITSQYGEFDIDEVTAWIAEFDDDIKNSIRLVDKEIDLILEPEISIDDISPELGGESIEKNYQLIVAFFDKPEMDELYQELLERGYNCTGQELKEIEQND